jgi:acyl-CoA thioesterase
MGHDGDEALAAARRNAAAMWAQDLASRHAGIEIADVGPGMATARMTVAPTMINGLGVCHGGWIFLLADTAFAFAGNSHGPTAFAQAADVVFVRPAHAGERLEAVARERTRYGRNALYDVTVRTGGEVVAEFRGRLRTVGDGPAVQ